MFHVEHRVPATGAPGSAAASAAAPDGQKDVAEAEAGGVAHVPLDWDLLWTQPDSG